MTSGLKELFLLDPNIIFLNHGSFGATPRPVMDVYQQWQHRLEQQPVQFIVREMQDELKLSRRYLGEYLGAMEDDLVFIPNATFGANIIARSLRLSPGDEVLISSHEYGACENIWEFICQKTGASLIRQHIFLPVGSPSELVDQFWSGVTSNTKVIFISHITSPTAICLPVKAICHKARTAGIITVIDGAHAPGQIRLDLESIGADFYVGNCHKWMLSPKGSGFLYTRREAHELVESLVVSWGWGENSPYTTGSKYLDSLEWWGTIDPSAYLSVPAAIQFQEDHDWPIVQRDCQQILENGIQAINQLTGMKSIYAEEAERFVQMAIVPIPNVENLSDFQTLLYQQYQIEVPCIQWKDLQFIRISVQGYNSSSDIEALISALDQMIPPC
jgi:isopenicillin-N epimerase